MQIVINHKNGVKLLHAVPTWMVTRARRAHVRKVHSAIADFAESQNDGEYAAKHRQLAGAPSILDDACWHLAGLMPATEIFLSGAGVVPDIDYAGV